MADIRDLNTKLLYKLYKKITDPSFFLKPEKLPLPLSEFEFEYEYSSAQVQRADEQKKLKFKLKLKLLDIILHLLVYPIYIEQESIDSLRGYRFTVKPDIKINKQKG